MAEENKLERAQQIFLKTCKVMDDRGWHYQKDEENLAMNFGVRGDDLAMDFRIKVEAERQFVFLTSVLPFIVPEDKRIEMALAVNAVNCKLVAGNFDFLLQDGKVAFRICQTFMESDIGEDALERLIMSACSIIDDQNEKFMGISTGELDLGQFLEELNSI